MNGDRGGQKMEPLLLLGKIIIAAWTTVSFKMSIGISLKLNSFSGSNTIGTIKDIGFRIMQIAVTHPIHEARLSSFSRFAASGLPPFLGELFAGFGAFRRFATSGFKSSLRGGIMAGTLLFAVFAFQPEAFALEASAITQVQKEAFTENQTAAETNADSEKKSEHWRREIGGEEFVNIHVAYSFCFSFALGVVFGFAVWCVPNLICLYLEFKDKKSEKSKKK